MSDKAVDAYAWVSNALGQLREVERQLVGAALDGAMWADRPLALSTLRRRCSDAAKTLHDAQEAVTKAALFAEMAAAELKAAEPPTSYGDGA